MVNREAQLDRNIIIARLFVDDKRTICDLARDFKTSRQRIHQILQKKLGADCVKTLATEHRILRRVSAKKNRPTFICAFCSKNFTVPFKSMNRKFCGLECRNEHSKERTHSPKHIEEQKRLRSERIMRWQRAHPEKISEYNKITAENLRTDPERRARYREQQEKSLLKRLGSMDAVKKYRSEIMRNYYKKIKEDPVKWKEYKKRHNEYDKKKRASLKLLSRGKRRETLLIRIKKVREVTSKKRQGWTRGGVV